MEMMKVGVEREYIGRGVDDRVTVGETIIMEAPNYRKRESVCVMSCHVIGWLVGQ